MKRIPKGLFFWAYGAVGVVSYAIPHLLPCVLPSGIDYEKSPNIGATNLPLLLLAPLVLQLAALFSLIVFCVFIHRIWKAIQDGHAGTSPNKAVGFFFIPVFHLYWVFQMFWGFAKDYNSFIYRHELNLRKLPEWLYFAHSLLISIAVLMVAPIAMRRWMHPSSTLGPESPLILSLSVVALVRIVLELVVIWKTCDAVNAIPDSLIQRNLRELGMLEPDNAEVGEYQGAREISKPLHIALFLAGFPASALLLYLVIIQITEGNVFLAALLVPFPLVALACSFHALIDTIHKSWKAIQDGCTRTSPREAVNFLFIPVFNLYWVFRGIGSFAKNYNRLLKRHGLGARRLSTPLYMVFSVFAATFPLMFILLLSFGFRAITSFSFDTDSTVADLPWHWGIPLLWIVAGVIFICKSCDAINALPMLKPVDVSYQSSTDYPDKGTTT